MFRRLIGGPILADLPDFLAVQQELLEELAETPRRVGNTLEVLDNPILFDTTDFSLTANEPSPQSQWFCYAFSRPELEDARWTDQEADTRHKALTAFQSKLDTAGSLLKLYTTRYAEALSDGPEAEVRREISKRYHLLAHHAKSLIDDEGSADHHQGLLSVKCGRLREDRADCYDLSEDIDLGTEQARSGSDSRTVMHSLYSLIKERMSHGQGLTDEEDRELRELFSRQTAASAQ
ncbi:uncharacterized protein I303_107596 [Kwoniella dejecticola CBS 10117]|uniref:Uncharacterized protein n=1 Tax=Kwoniella dejecticola CBS 10117 TaxID=1296121 RepID=A0A1A5ZV64_9TREE|nr:uncharacterized protein I303_07606 [Kwoniella dejecticola CBS 10117]OBR81696.1 hypothetical protein I303_07606 [Kwoniella dejecticola CBS 10117]